MKRQIVIAALSILLIITCLLAACGADTSQSIFPSSPQSDTHSVTQSTDAAIRELESRIEQLLNDQSASESEQAKELELLRAELAELKKESETKPAADSDSEETSETVMGTRFLYSTEGDTAIITGYTGDDTHIVIPSSIDGYTVTQIGENAFSSSKLKSVIITNGITEIDWFAFDGCTALEAITIPSSVSSIGYSAFASAPTNMTIYCHSGSFAQSYAKSYGLSYTII